jgi:hypothetical protein
MRIRLRKTRLVGVSVAAVAAVAAVGSAPHALRIAQSARALVAPQLVATAQARPHQVFHVILKGTSERTLVSAIRRTGGGLTRRLSVIDGASAGVSGHQLVALANAKGVSAISLDQPVHLLGGISNSQQ